MGADEVLDKILKKNAEELRKKKKKEAHTDKFKSEIKDVFTNIEIGYNKIAEDFYEEVKGNTFNKKDSKSWEHDAINKYSLDIELEDFIVLTTYCVYMDMLVNGVVEYQKAGETLSVIKMLQDSISNGRKSTDHVYPNSLETAMGGDNFQSNKKFCFCVKYSEKVYHEDETITTEKIHFLCVHQDRTNPGKISHMSDVFITEDTERSDENDIKSVCKYAKRQNSNEYEDTKDNYCELHSASIKLKSRHECSIPILDYMMQLRNKFLDEIVNNYFEKSDYISEMKSFDAGMNSRLKTRLIEDFEKYGSIVYSRLIKGYNDHNDDLSYIG